MNIKVLISCTAVLLFAASPKVFSQETLNLCYKGHCFVPTLDGFLKKLPDETDYELLGLGSSRFLKLTTPVNINGQAFNVQYNEMTIKKSKWYILEYEYKFTPRSKVMCKERYHDLLRSLNTTHGPLKAKKKLKKISKGYTSKTIKEPTGLFYLQTANNLGTYKDNASEAKLTSGVTIRVSSTMMSSATHATQKNPSCRLNVLFLKVIK